MPSPNHFCTYFDSGYAPRGLAMLNSVLAFMPDARLHALCLDALAARIVRDRLPSVRVITLDELEASDPALAACKPTRSVVEYYFTCTPCLPLHVLATEADVGSITYLDADLLFYQSPERVFEEIAGASVAIVPHRFSPANADRARFGVYNVSWVTWRNDEEGRRCLEDYRRDCLAWCFDRLEEDRFADQKYLDRWPDRYRSVHALAGKGMNLALWNVDNYALSRDGSAIRVDDDPLIFVHFHGLRHVGPSTWDTGFQNYSIRDTGFLREALYLPYLRILDDLFNRLAGEYGLPIPGDRRFGKDRKQLAVSVGSDGGSGSAPPTAMGAADPDPLSGSDGQAEAWRGRRVLVTGGLGFIGSTLARRLMELGAEVLAIDSMVPEYGGNLFNLEGCGDRVRVNISDMRDRHSMRHLVHDREFIFNLAGQTSHLDSMHDPFTDLEINCTSQLGLLEICRLYNPSTKIVFASTRQIYGRPRYLPVDEAHPLCPTDVNGINKIAGESYHQLYNTVYGIPTAVLRLTNTYGPRMRVKDARQTFLGVWVRAVIEGKPFEVWGGEQLRDFTYVDDAVDALLRLALAKDIEGQALNLGGDAVVSLRAAAEAMAAVSGGSFVIREFPAERKRIDIGDYYADDRAFRAATGWVPRVSLAEGLERTIEYYRRHLTRYL